MNNYFFDIGANIGQTFDEYLAKHPEYDGWNVFCFEPSPRHLAQLLQKAEEYKDRYQITIFPFGIGRCGLYRFGQREDPLADQFAYHGYSEYFSKPGYEIIAHSVRLETIMNLIPFLPDQFVYPKVVLKLDCEGAEYSIMSDIDIALQFKTTRYHLWISKILIEWHPNPEYTNQDKLSLENRVGSQIPIEPWTL